MNPIEARQQDWHLYYNGTYMLHEKKGPVYVQVSEDDRGRPLLRYKLPHGRTWTATKPKLLTCWWPRAGSFNSGGRAFFVGRRPRRNMKKSAADHYYCLWGGGGDWGQLLRTLAHGEKFMSMKGGQECIDKGVMDSVAINRDIIITIGTQPNEYGVIYKGNHAGAIRDNRFFPSWEGVPAAKLAKIKLEREGVRCT